MKTDEFKVLDEKLDRVLEYMDVKFGAVDKRFDDFEKRFEKNDKDHDRIMSVLDYHTKMISTLDQGRLFSIERIKRIEDDVTNIKRHLKLGS